MYQRYKTQLHKNDISFLLIQIKINNFINRKIFSLPLNISQKLEKKKETIHMPRLMR